MTFQNVRFQDVGRRSEMTETLLSPTPVILMKSATIISKQVYYHEN